MHLAAPCYARALRMAQAGGPAASGGGGAAAASAVPPAHRDLSRESAHNLACILRASGSDALARHVVRTFLTV